MDAMERRVFLKGASMGVLIARRGESGVKLGYDCAASQCGQLPVAKTRRLP